MAEGLAAGADLILFSGDKLLGGPQCGILVGKAQSIALVKKDPLMRAFRVDKMTLAALEATLQLALHDRMRSIPLWNLLAVELPALIHRAERIASRFRDDLGLNAVAIESTSRLGGGSMPIDSIPTAAVRLAPPWPSEIADEAEFARRLRTGEIAVYPRIRDGAVLLDLRAVPEGDDERIVAAVTQLVGREISNPTNPA